jgi:hypothetical protein
MRALKVLLVVAAVLVGTFLFVANFSAIESRFACAGEISGGPNPGQTSLFVKLHEYRWWVGLWSDSQASVWIEIPNTWVQYFHHVRVVGDQLQIFEDPTSLRGNFSKLSRSLSIILPVGAFTGTCTPQ